MYLDMTSPCFGYWLPISCVNVQPPSKSINLLHLALGVNSTLYKGGLAFRREMVHVLRGRILADTVGMAGVIFL